MGPYAWVDYKPHLRFQHIHEYARVDFIPQSGTLDLASARGQYYSEIAKKHKKLEFRKYNNFTKIFFILKA